MDGGAWWVAVLGVAKGRTRLSDFTFTFPFHALEKEMAIHSSALAWRIPGTGEPGGLPSMGSHRVGHDRSDLAAAGVGCVFPVSQCNIETQETLYWKDTLSLDWKDPMEEEMTTHSCILAGKKSQGQRSLVGYSPWGPKKSSTAE